MKNALSVGTGLQKENKIKFKNKWHESWGQFKICIFKKIKSIQLARNNTLHSKFMKVHKLWNYVDSTNVLQHMSV